MNKTMYALYNGIQFDISVNADIYGNMVYTMSDTANEHIHTLYVGKVTNRDFIRDFVHDWNVKISNLTVAKVNNAHSTDMQVLNDDQAKTTDIIKAQNAILTDILKDKVRYISVKFDNDTNTIVAIDYRECVFDSNYLMEYNGCFSRICNNIFTAYNADEISIKALKKGCEALKVNSASVRDFIDLVSYKFNGVKGTKRLDKKAFCRNTANWLYCVLNDITVKDVTKW